MSSEPELLAPVGSWEALEAAVNNGADAVYLGGKNFSARQYANNFDELEMAKALDYAHLRGVKVFVTANTLIADHEVEPALDYLKFLYEAGVDAVILQDLGLTKLVRQALPKLELHASTQMTIHNLAGVLEMEDLGFSRVVLAREVSLENIQRIHTQCQADLEVFIHGALCISYSGQCLMSSLIGGRSGNRGRCAQPCRLKYTLVDKRGKAVDDQDLGPHILSPRDIWMIEHLPDLMQAGVSSFKIEGRMKRPEYVATVVRTYRQALDRALSKARPYEIDPEERKGLYQIFNRDFSNAYFFGNPGRDLMSYKRPNNRGLRLGRVESYDYKRKLVTVALEEPLGIGDGIEVWISQGGRQGINISKLFVGNQSVERARPGDKVTFEITGKIRPGDRVFKTNDASLMERAKLTFGQQGKEKGKLPVWAEVTAQVGLALKVNLKDDLGNQGEGLTQFIAEPAIKRPLTEETINKQLDRLGNTPFTLAGLVSRIEGDVMVPVSEINEARRLAVEDLIEHRLAPFRREPVKGWTDIKKGFQLHAETRNSVKTDKIKLSVSVGEVSAVKEAVQAGADLVYFGTESFRSKPTIGLKELAEAAQLCHQKGAKLIVGTPRLLQDHQMTNYLQKLPQLVELADGVLVGNIGLLREFRKYSVDIYADHSFNLYNRFSAECLKELGVKQVSLSPELTMEQVAQIGRRLHNIEVEAMVHGALTMMISEYCAPGAIAGGRSAEQKCSQPCRKESYSLKDRMNFLFPIETDEFCRMHIFNPKELCMIEHLEELVSLGVSVLRLELKKESPQRVGQVVKAYRQELTALTRQGQNYGFSPGIKERLEANTQGFTKGHYFRGVV